jgi:hypothetical protein
MASLARTTFNKEYHAVYCNHCRKPILGVSPDGSSDNFQLMCHWIDCHQMGTYQQSSIVRVRLGDNADDNPPRSAPSWQVRMMTVCGVIVLQL